ncbi:sugar kinase [Acrocarpospora phusangensis]|uniref:Sugar kinase n=1 Tax=Acrocarpospora phusangensis TaxID=1070424 RepID=A0A919QLH7_9ACTN|nr:hexose kinase [Acrocarpospora phusangensis]GIH28480.1 sugar kinase [Acrocarpospora phusangensis]
MILTVTLNPALDVTYRVPGLTLEAVNRVAGVSVRAGGKGLNVARVLHALGHEVTALGLAGGPDGDRLVASAGIPAAFTRVSGETRRTIAVVADSGVTMLNEAGPRISLAEWSAFQADFARRAPRASAVVLSGSLPPGLPADAYAVLAALAGDVPTVVDTEGDALINALAARPHVVKPNTDELNRTLGVTSVRDGAMRLRELGARAVVVSDGPRGLHADTPEGLWRAVPPYAEGNPTGAGDAAVAAIAMGVVARWDWAETLRHAAALSAAAVRAPLAGQADHTAYRANLAVIAAEPLEREGTQC